MYKNSEKILKKEEILQSYFIKIDAIYPERVEIILIYLGYLKIINNSVVQSEKYFNMYNKKWKIYKIDILSS